ncbi:MAG TPA: AraC family transcriptional regulator [Candidatus Dormibacteraeota bacterium]|nr:AraC family transcriptional regulator [Candidatus Dormibacteraeota bacterium]
MSEPGPKQVALDSRGILDPGVLRQRVRLTRYPPIPALEGLIDRFWAAQWDLPEGVEHIQRLLTHPGANLSVGRPDAGTGRRQESAIEARLNGVARRLTTRTLRGRGFAVAAMTAPGGVGAFITGSASQFTDRVVPLGVAIGVDEEHLIREIAEQDEESARVDRLADSLAHAVNRARAPAARAVAEVARLAETDRTVRSLGDLAARAGVSQRGLQRNFLREAGVSPMWVVRRYRLLEAAETVRAGGRVSWADVAAHLGYSDQAHLIRDFRAAVGQTPAAYGAAQARG